MGMELYASSPVAKEVWDRADKHFMDNYGKQLLLALLKTC
jgi:fatty acid synthase subunit beta